MSTYWDRRYLALRLAEFDSELWVSYRATAALYPAIHQATQRVLTACALYLGKRYAAVVPSRRVAQSVNYRVAPPRMYVGPKDFRANFWEVGTQPHRILARGVQLKVRRYKRWTKILGFHQGIRYLAIPVGGKTIFRTTARHPGTNMGGRYLKKTGEQSMSVLQEIAGKGYAEVFQ